MDYLLPLWLRQYIIQRQKREIPREIADHILYISAQVLQHRDPSTLAEPRRRSINQSFLHLHQQHALSLSTSRPAAGSSSASRPNRISFTDTSTAFQQLDIQDFDRLNAQEIIRLCLYVAKRSPLDFADPITCECVHTEGERSIALRRQHLSRSRSRIENADIPPAALSAADVYLSENMHIGKCVLDNPAYPISRSAKSLLTMAIFCARASGLQLQTHLESDNGIDHLSANDRASIFSSAKDSSLGFETNPAATAVSEASVSGARWLAKLGQVMFGGPCSHAGHSHHRRTRARLEILEQQNKELGRTILAEGREQYPSPQSQIRKRASVSSLASSFTRSPSSTFNASFSGASPAFRQPQQHEQQHQSDRWCQHCSRAMACLVVASVKESFVQNGSKLEETLLGAVSETEDDIEDGYDLSPEVSDSSSGVKRLGRPMSVSGSVSASSPSSFSPPKSKVQLPKFLFGRKRPASTHFGLSTEVELSDRVASPMPLVDSFRKTQSIQEEITEDAKHDFNPSNVIPHSIPITVARGRPSQSRLEMDLAEAASTPSPDLSRTSPLVPPSPFRSAEQAEESDPAKEDPLPSPRDTMDPLSASTHVLTRGHSQPRQAHSKAPVKASVPSRTTWIQPAFDHALTQKPIPKRRPSDLLKEVDGGSEDKGVLGAMGIYHPLHALGLHTPVSADSFVREVEESFRRLSSGSSTAEGWFPSKEDSDKEQDEKDKNSSSNKHPSQQQQPTRSPNLTLSMELEGKKGSDAGIEGGGGSAQDTTDTEGHLHVVPPLCPDSAEEAAVAFDTHPSSDLVSGVEERESSDQDPNSNQNVSKDTGRLIPEATQEIIPMSACSPGSANEEEEDKEDEEDKEEETHPTIHRTASVPKVGMDTTFAERMALNQENDMTRGAAATPETPETTSKPPVAAMNESKQDCRETEVVDCSEKESSAEEEEEVVVVVEVVERQQEQEQEQKQEQEQEQEQEQDKGVNQVEQEDTRSLVLNQDHSVPKSTPISTSPAYRPLSLTISTAHYNSGSSGSEGSSEAEDDHDSDYSQGSTIESPITPTDLDSLLFSAEEDLLKEDPSRSGYDRSSSRVSGSLPRRHKKRLLVDDAKRKQEQLERIKAQLEMKALGKIRRQISFWEERGVLEQKVVAVVEVDETEEKNGQQIQKEEAVAIQE